ncbi:hypothetical protein CAP48_04260 [Advenella sp. S44]|nr:hypothetical protein CAP48_04260 [Advenella sp. S44]
MHITGLYLVSQRRYKRTSLCKNRQTVFFSFNPAELSEVLVQHVAGSGIAFLWEQQLLNTPVPRNAG